MTGKDAAQYLRDDGACDAACEYVASHATLDDAIAQASRVDWLCWLTRYDPDIAVRFARWCAAAYAADARAAARAAAAAARAAADATRAAADATRAATRAAADAAIRAAYAAAARAADAYSAAYAARDAARVEQLAWLKGALKTFKLPERP